MKKRGRSFGDIDMDYRLLQIFYSSSLKFYEAHAELTSLEKQYRQDGVKRQLISNMMVVSEKRREAGAMLLMSAVAHLEQFLYEYAVRFLDPNSYEEHLGRTRLVSRWILIPRICENIIVDEAHPAINDLRELVAARNAITHSKRLVMYQPTDSIRRMQKEETRFIAACRKAEKTVAAVKSLLNKKPNT